MKYWWLEKYRNFKIIQMQELLEEVNYFLIMPKNMNQKYSLIQTKEIEELIEEDLRIMLFNIVNSKNIKDNKLRLIIEKLLTYQDTSLPASDYTITEMVEEVRNLKLNYPTADKLTNNNVAVCYHCQTVFYVDKIKSMNKQNLCLCPYCHSTKLYFDNDYIPMNATFIKLANLYYCTSRLGSKFPHLQKLIKNKVKLTTKQQETTGLTIDLTELLNQPKILPQEEQQIYKQIYDLFMTAEKKLERKITLLLPLIANSIKETTFLLLSLVMMEVLSNSLYLETIQVVVNPQNLKSFQETLKVLTKKSKSD